MKFEILFIFHVVSLLNYNKFDCCIYLMKKYRIRCLILVLLFLNSVMLNGQPEWSVGDYLSDSLYDKEIYTCILSPNESLIDFPAIRLNSEAQLRLQFDDFNNESKDYLYRFVHCNADWTVSDLYNNQFIDGFSDNYINNYDFSFATKTSYVHYELLFPNNDVSFLLSGNYVLCVYDSENPDRPIFTKRFMVYDDSLLVGAKVKQATFAKNRYTDHEVDVVVNFTNVNYVYPIQDVNVVIYQGHQWSNFVSNLKPSYIESKRLEYDYEDETSFSGGNEYRFFDTKSIRFYTERVYKIEQGAIDNVILYTDFPWKNQAYSIYPDIEGYYVPNILERKDVNTQADYVKVDFSLKQKPFSEQGNLYVYGGLTNWSLNENAKMTYNERNACYETSLILKQGYYNYTYMFVPEREGVMSQTAVDGAYFETSQDYHVFVYLYDHQLGYDRLLGMSKVSTKDIF